MFGILDSLVVLNSTANPTTKTGDATEVNTLLTTVINMVTSIGASVFILAVLIIALCIIFGSISPKNIGKWWTALFSCIAGAILFFGAHLLQGTIAGLFGA